MRILLTLITLLISLQPALASAEEFYLELGIKPTETEAEESFAEMQAKNKVLEDYDVFPNAILQPDGSFAYRVQAGPMIDRAEADKVCRRLRRNKLSCFVIEGFDPQKPATFAPKTDAESAPTSSDFSLPWLQQKSAPVAGDESVASQSSTAASESGSFFGAIGSLFESDSNESKESEPALPDEVPMVSNRAAAVNVAEAIPVEVTTATGNDNLQPLIVVGSVGEIADVATSTSASPSETSVQGWLNIQPFLDEARANKFWAHVRKHASERTADLELQIIHPVVSNDVPKVIANVGKFASEGEAARFCNDVVVPASRYLECRFSTSPPDGTAQRSRESSQAIGSVIDEEHSLFWVELLSAKNQDAVLDQWEKVRTDHDDLLMNVRSQITTSFANPGTYLVRVGPMNAKSKAEKLCSTLQKRKLACKVVGL